MSTQPTENIRVSAAPAFPGSKYTVRVMGKWGSAPVVKTGLRPARHGFAFCGHAPGAPADSIGEAAYFLAKGGQICL